MYLTLLEGVFFNKCLSVYSINIWRRKEISFEAAIRYEDVGLGSKSR